MEQTPSTHDSKEKPITRIKINLQLPQCRGANQSSTDLSELLNDTDPQKAVMNEPIKFYSTADEYGEFSNFSAYPIQIGGRMWPTSEHYFQAMKFNDKSKQEKIRKAHSPMVAAKIGRDRKNKLRKDWESTKVNVMRDAVMAKFSQHVELRELLLDTGDAKLIEHTANDSYWGDGGDGKGKNMLGRILMEVRAALRQQVGSR